MASNGSVLQCVAVCCSVLQCVAVCCSVLQCVAACCNVLKCAAVCCSVLQCVAKTHRHQSHCESLAERPGCASGFLRPAVVLLAVPFDLFRC